MVINERRAVFSARRPLLMDVIIVGSQLKEPVGRPSTKQATDQSLCLSSSRRLPTFRLVSSSLNWDTTTAVGPCQKSPHTVSFSVFVLLSLALSEYLSTMIFSSCRCPCPCRRHRRLLLCLKDAFSSVPLGFVCPDQAALKLQTFTEKRVEAII